MISAAIVIIIALLTVGVASDDFSFAQTGASEELRGHLPLATGVRQMTDAGDVTAHLPVEKNKYLPPHALPGAVPFASATGTLSAASGFAVDNMSGEVLFEKNADEIRSIASITKLMTALVVLDTLPDMAAPVTIAQEDLRIGREYIAMDETIHVNDLFGAMLIGSSNTAAAALARASGLSAEEFSARMNQKAKAMGLTHTVFVEPTGLDSGNIATARELSVIARYALSKNEIARMMKRRTFSLRPLSGGGTRQIFATNWLLTGQTKRMSDATILGGKTGFNDMALYSIALLVEKNSHPITIVVLGAMDHFARFTEADLLARMVYDQFVWAGEDGY